MIGLDTNVLIRYVAQDEPAQAAAATALIEGLSETEPGYVSLVTVVELAWVLERSYRVPADAIAATVRGLLTAREIVAQEPEVVTRALDRTASGAGFADAVIAELGTQAGCSHTVTFDRVAARIAGMRLLA